MTVWLPDGGVFVAGKPLTDIWAAPGLRWRDALLAEIRGPLRNPRLQFVRSDRSWYDLDNLTYPVLAAIGTSTCDSVWSTVSTGHREGVRIYDDEPPPPPVEDAVARLYIATPSTSSVADRPPAAELDGQPPIGVDEPLGLALEFDSPTVLVGEMSYEGPVKSLIDDLAPLFGYRAVSGKPVAQDHRVKELRITRGHNSSRSGVTVTIWPMPPAPDLR